MYGVNAEHHPVGNIYAHRPLLNIGDFIYARQAVNRATGSSPAFHPRPPGTAGVSLLTSHQLRWALEKSSALRGMSVGTVMSTLKNALPVQQTPPDGLPVETVDVAVLEAKHRHLVAYVEHPDLTQNQAAVLWALYQLGGVALEGVRPHVSFGTFDRRVPAAVLPALERSVPNTFLLGGVAVDDTSTGQWAA